MNVYGTTFVAPDQTELSRVAAEQYARSEAVRERRADVRRSRLDHRLRHALAVRLQTTARLIDAT